MTNIIKPTVGRIVHYYASGVDHAYGMAMQPGEPLAAVVACVWDDRCVNLTVFDQNGTPHGRTSAKLVQPEDDQPDKNDGGFCCWMSFQVKGKATGSESGEKAAGTEEIGLPTLKGPWKHYRRAGLTVARPYVPGENLEDVSVSKTDTPREGGLIARNPDDAADQWYISPEFQETAQLEAIS